MVSALNKSVSASRKLRRRRTPHLTDENEGR